MLPVAEVELKYIGILMKSHFCCKNKNLQFQIIKSIFVPAFWRSICLSSDMQFVLT